ncbi:hypothetical protein [Actinoallomurus rhizosphaericola]|uniref:hypothetical protein n=1 Tax=Actinoallomurus rhizosphaericola TaxID=2952536 RepID=UPI002092AA0B|nr:hypothetical protein [Actinoallomurus rhizosphaericola]MCO5996128.1 hypothetical protein [Actinoallomurus rhizosphaericola]
MALDDFIDSAPSVTGAAMVGYSSIFVPSAIPLALLLGTAISDPAQIWHAGDRHNASAAQAEKAKTELIQAVDRVSQQDGWKGEAKQTFESTAVEPYKMGLDSTSQGHKGIADSLAALARAYMGAGLLSMTIGGICVACATAVAGTLWLPGANVATESAAMATVRVATTTFQRLLTRLLTLLGKAANLMKSIKGLLGLGALYYGGGYMKNMELGASKPQGTVWPGVKPASGPMSA